MKRLLSIFLVIIVLSLSTAMNVSASGIEISDELIDAIRVLKNDDALTKSDFKIHYSYEISENKELVLFDRAISAQPCVSCSIVMGEYKMSIGQPPIPMILYDGKLYHIKDAYDEQIVTYDDLEIMGTFEDVSVRKIGWSYEEKFVDKYVPDSKKYSYQELYHHYENNNYMGMDPDWTLAKASSGDTTDSDIRYLKYDDFVLTSKESNSAFTMGYAVFDASYYDGDNQGHCFYDLVKDYELIKDRAESFEDILRELDGAIKIGDCDFDGELSVFDSTAIQRVIAKIEATEKYTDERGLEFYFEDIDSDGEVSILDATMIQCFVAQITADI